MAFYFGVALIPNEHVISIFLVCYKHFLEQEHQWKNSINMGNVTGYLGHMGTFIRGLSGQTTLNTENIVYDPF